MLTRSAAAAAATAATAATAAPIPAAPVPTTRKKHNARIPTSPIPTPTTPKKHTVTLEPGTRVVVSPSATGEGTHVKWLYDDPDADADADAIMVPPTSDVNMYDALSPVSSGSSEEEDEEEAEAEEAGEEEGLFRPMNASMLEVSRLVTPSPRASFDAGSVLDTPRKNKHNSNNTTKNKGKGKAPAHPRKGSPHARKGSLQVLGLLSEPAAEAALLAYMQRKFGAPARRSREDEIRAVQVRNLLWRRDTYGRERERWVRLTERQRRAERKHWERYGTDYVAGSEESEEDKEDSSMEESSVVEEEPYKVGPLGHRLGPEGTVLCREDGTVIMDNEDSSHSNASTETAEDVDMDAGVPSTPSRRMDAGAPLTPRRMDAATPLTPRRMDAATPWTPRRMDAGTPSTPTPNSSPRRLGPHRTIMNLGDPFTSDEENARPRQRLGPEGTFLVSPSGSNTQTDTPTRPGNSTKKRVQLLGPGGTYLLHVDSREDVPSPSRQSSRAARRFGPYGTRRV